MPVLFRRSPCYNHLFGQRRPGAQASRYVRRVGRVTVDQNFTNLTDPKDHEHDASKDEDFRGTTTHPPSVATAVVLIVSVSVAGSSLDGAA